jgi:hypothetical protein
MTEFKNGDRIRAVRDTITVGGRPIKEGEQFVALDEPDYRAYMSVIPLSGRWPARDGFPFEASGNERIVSPEDFEHVEDHGTGDGSASEERRFPAPLDPAKVAVTLKGGDYIEAESDGAKVGGKVSHVTERGLVAIEHLGEFAIHHITAPSTRGGYRMFALTAHQPAPEPEPADALAQAVWEAMLADGAEGHEVFRADKVADAIRAKFVVIDPADVDEQNRLAAIIREVDGNHDKGAAALAEAILERLSR